MSKHQPAFTNKPPVVMCFSGHDPSGGAGLQADIEAITAHGCHATTVVTALTVQDTNNVIDYSPLPEDLIIEQARAVLEDMPVSAFKIGMTGSVGNIEAIHTLLRDYSHIPVVLDPVLAAGGGHVLSTEELVDAINTLLIPQSKIITPNIPEAHRLAPTADSTKACAMQLLENGAELVLITGTHAKTEQVKHTLYGNNRELDSYQYPRLANHYHGSGCTLASSIAALLAQSQEPFSAIHAALDFTWNSLEHAGCWSG